MEQLLETEKRADLYMHANYRAIYTHAKRKKSLALVSEQEKHLFKKQ